MNVIKIFKWMLGQKNEAAARASVSFMQKNAVVINLTPEIAVLAAKFSRELGLPLADSIIYATAKTKGATIYTKDRHFENLEGAHYFAKP